MRLYYSRKSPKGSKSNVNAVSETTTKIFCEIFREEGVISVSIMAVQDWESIGNEKRAQAAEKIPKAWRLDAKYTATISETASNNVLNVPGECGLLTSKQLDITENYDATALLENMHSGALSAFEVTEAFCIRAAIAQQVVRLGRFTSYVDQTR